MKGYIDQFYNEGFATIFYLVIGLDFVTIMLFYTISLLSVSSTNLIGMYIDSIQPKLVWMMKIML